MEKIKKSYTRFLFTFNIHNFNFGNIGRFKFCRSNFWPLPIKTWGVEKGEGEVLYYFNSMYHDHSKVVDDRLFIYALSFLPLKLS